ncbi:hypothetical protein OG453_29220 [Streptomyces sp. NBC_01381]|uniref:hypothetical protein n=1 Tax=Streptomyces sp. NBC_01381 TaxID=2903845 RepID=UPI00224D99F0|nr:hypothetical protein [Streptomyces sp. NBC_01381]MCX4670727.1 hypothetical protein [Streptomyces sp. NBC_01381]
MPSWIRIMRSPWQAGPEAHAPGPVLVSVTEFTAHRHSQTLPIALSGLRLRRNWPGLPGAVGMWLWVEPLRKRSGSVSVWIGERSLYAFVARPDHLRTVRAHRDRGAMRATVWTADRLAPDALWAEASALLTGSSPWPEPAVHTPEGK